MAELRNDELLLPAKRCSDPHPHPAPEAIPNHNDDVEDENSTKRLKLHHSASDFEDKKVDAAVTHNSHHSDSTAKEEDEEEDEEDYNAEEDDYDEDEDEDEDGIDRKGKGVMRDDKGKGKLIEESDSDSDSGSDSDAFDTDTDDANSDDPLAEVDLDNILPSRTRRRSLNPGVSISNAPGKDKPDNNDGSDA